MVSMKTWMLGAAVLASSLGLGAATAQAAGFRVDVRGPVAYVPPCPGPGYVWAAGRWNFIGHDRDVRITHFDRDRVWERDRHFDRYRR